MKLLMVYCSTPQDNTVPVGITQLVTSLMQAGYEVELFHTTFHKQGFQSSAENRINALQFKSVELTYEETDLYEDFRKKIVGFKPQIIGFSVFEVTFNLFKSMLGHIEDIVASNNIKVAVGGVHALFWPESIAEVKGVDFIATGEAEKTFVDLCQKIENNQSYLSQPGFWIMNDGQWIKNKPNELINLDKLPFNDPYIFGERFSMKPMMGKLWKTATIEISRGCPYKCTYCADPFLTKMFENIGRWHRVKSIERLDEEYDHIIQNYKPEFIYKFSETMLAGGKQWFNDYYEMYKKYRLPFWTESRPETITDENAKKLADLNCIRFSMGLESGNEEYRKKYLKRGYSNKRFLEATSTLRRNGISFSLNLIIGLPFETREMVFDGIRLLREIKPDGISVFIYTPYKGSALRSLCEENNMIDRNFIGDDYFQMKYALRNNTWGQEVLGLWRTVPLYVHLPESRYPTIRKAEEMTVEGDRVFAQLRIEFFEKMGWQ